jgi:hypothetical protein
MSKQPVVLYGASGYTGRLVAEFLREYQLPFIAAGRNPEAIQAAMDKVPGIETASYEVVKVDHNVESLTELFSGAKVVCNTVGPFARFGTVVVEAALKADCHYIDTTGEQDWMIQMRDIFGAAFAEKDLLLSPSSAYMYSVCNIAAEFCMEQKGIDSLDAVCVPCGVPTVGSTRTVMDMVRQNQKWLLNGELVDLESPMLMCAEVPVSGRSSTVLALPWGGGSLPLWYADDERVINCQSMTGFTDRGLMQGVVDVAKHYDENLKGLSWEEQEAALDQMADGVTPGMPPRENRNIHRTVDMCYGVGHKKQVKCSLIGNSGYIQTGLIQAFVANQLVRGKPRVTGFQSCVKAVGHEELYAALEGYGLLSKHIEVTSYS